MSAPDLLAGTVMDRAASLLNDTAKTVYTYAAQTPYINIAMQELQEHFELNSIPVSEAVSAVINVPTGVTSINYNAIGAPRLPDDMVEPLQLWERQAGIDPFTPMTRVGFLPHNLETQPPTNQLIYWAWISQSIKLMPSNQSNDVKIDYIRYLFTTITDQNTPIGIINAATFLEYRTAGLCAEFIERNITSANSLNAMAVLSLDRVTGIGAKGKQAINTRRRPFRSGYKKRGWMT